MCPIQPIFFILGPMKIHPDPLMRVIERLTTGGHHIYILLFLLLLLILITTMEKLASQTTDPNRRSLSRGESFSQLGTSTANSEGPGLHNNSGTTTTHQNSLLPRNFFAIVVLPLSSWQPNLLRALLTRSTLGGSSLSCPGGVDMETLVQYAVSKLYNNLLLGGESC